MNEKLKRLVPEPAKRKIKKMRDDLRFAKSGKSYKRGFVYAENWQHANGNGPVADLPADPQNNPLWDYFARHETGPGIWKWHHYFDIYHNHCSKFIGKPVKVLEVGIFAGGSLPMWRSYFGPKSHIYGIDIEEACRIYESENVTVFIGNQEDPAFWDEFVKQVPEVDIIIDDGGHAPGQQIVTLEKMLPRLTPGGVYVCEDIHGIHNGFTEFASGLVSELNRTGEKKGQVYSASGYQAYCHSMHFYPFVTVIERTAVPRTKFFSLKKGTQWQPFRDKTS